MNVIEWPARRCSGESCKQGRSECKTPAACMLPEPPEDRACEDGGGVAVWLVIGVAAVCGLAAAVHVAAKAGLL